MQKRWFMSWAVSNWRRLYLRLFVHEATEIWRHQVRDLLKCLGILLEDTANLWTERKNKHKYSLIIHKNVSGLVTFFPQISISVCSYWHVYVCMPKCPTCAHTSTYTHKDIHTHTHTWRHVHAHTHTHSHTHTHTHLSLPLSLPLSMCLKC